MSEYQYYEFAAIDKPLTLAQQAELRLCSTRATISASHFVNEYYWGDLKAEPLDWMERYFDAHIYLANWGSTRLLLRLPRLVLDKALLNDFCVLHKTGESNEYSLCTATATPQYWILDWSFDDESGEGDYLWDRNSGMEWMARLQPLRNELLRGDTRPLYLGWLARLANGEFSEDNLEPTVPAGLQNLSPAQTALAEFLKISPDWLTAAARNSPPINEHPTLNTIQTWLHQQDSNTMRSWVELLLTGRSQEAERNVRTHFRRWENTLSPVQKGLPRRVQQIQADYENIQTERAHATELARAAEIAQHNAERIAHLTHLAENAKEHWQSIDKTLRRGSERAYQQAITAVLTLSEAYSLTGRSANFDHDLKYFLASHTSRPAWIKRLTDVGLF